MAGTDYKRILIRRGTGDLPADLQTGEFALKTDTNELFIGVLNDVHQIVKQAEFDDVGERLTTAEETLSNHTHPISGVEGLEAALNTKVTQADIDAAITNGQIETNKTDIATNKTNIQTNKESIANVRSDLTDGLALKQDTLVSGTNIRTLNSNALLGSGDIQIIGGKGGLATRTELGNQFGENEVKTLDIESIDNFDEIEIRYVFYDDNINLTQRQLLVVETDLNDIDSGAVFLTPSATFKRITIKRNNVQGTQLEINYPSLPAETTQKLEFYGLTYANVPIEIE